jgi:NADPH:quinone reductase-like Zn-dependent oxidoreductase
MKSRHMKDLLQPPPYPLPPGQPGHEASGYVEAVGKNVNELRVGTEWHRWYIISGKAHMLNFNVMPRRICSNYRIRSAFCKQPHLNC